MPNLGDIRRGATGAAQVWAVPTAAAFMGLPFPSWVNPAGTAAAEQSEVLDALNEGFTNMAPYRQVKQALRQQLPPGYAKKQTGLEPHRQTLAMLRNLIQMRSMGQGVPEAPTAPPGLGLGGGGYMPPKGGMGGFDGGGGGPGTIFMPGDGPATYSMDTTIQPHSLTDAQHEVAASVQYQMLQNTHSIPKGGTTIPGIQNGTIVLGTASSFVRLRPSKTSTAVMDGSCIQHRAKIKGPAGGEATLHFGLQVDPLGGTAYVHNWDESVTTGTASWRSLDEVSVTIGSNGSGLIVLPESWWARGGANPANRQVGLQLSDTTQTVTVEAALDWDSIPSPKLI